MAASQWLCLKARDTELNRRKCQGTEAGPGQNGCDLLRTNDAPGTAVPSPPLASSRQSVGDAHGLTSIIGSLLTSQRHNLFLGSASCCHGNTHSSHGTCGSDTLWSIGRGAYVSQLHRRPVRPCLSDFPAWRGQWRVDLLGPKGQPGAVRLTVCSRLRCICTNWPGSSATALKGIWG